MSQPAETNAESRLATARLAADELVRALESARDQTGQWSDQSMTDALVHAAMQRCLTRLSQSGCWGEANRILSNEVWDIAGEWLKSGWLQRRAREKPRGYAGDFELLAKIDGRFISDDPLGRSFDAFFQNQSAPQAVRNRHQWLRQEMVDLVRRRGGQQVHWATVGCGPACDVRAALADLTVSQRRVIRVTLLDLDPAALDFAAEQVSRLLPRENIRTVRENLFRLSRVAGKADVLSEANFLSCPGLFDYLNDADAAALLATFWDRLVAGGRMMVFNFAPRHPSQAYMEWIGNWYLTYRSQADLEMIARQSGIPARCSTISSKSTGTDFALIANKPTGKAP